MNLLTSLDIELEEELHERAHIDYDRVSIIANPSVPALYEDALVYETGSAITSTGALSAYSGAKTGRSPSDKRIVKEESSENNVWWGPVNKPMSTDVSTAQPSPRTATITLASPESSKCAHAFPRRASDVRSSHYRASGSRRRLTVPRIAGEVGDTIKITSL